MAGERCARYGGRALRATTAVVTLVVAGLAAAQESAPDSHRGQMYVSFQRSVAQDLHASDFTIRTNPITARAIDFSVDYQLNDRWTLTGGLPWIEKKAWVPSRSHDPLLVTPPHPESDYVDDGQFHGYLQDLSLGIRYLAFAGPIVVEPYLTRSIPVGDYPFFAVAAIGQQLLRTEVGSTIAYRPPFLRWFFSLRAGYVFSPETLGQNTDATRVDGEAIYFVGPRVAIRTFFSSKNGKGFPPPRRPTDVPSEVWYQHDRMLRHNYATLGVGVDWTLNDRNVLGVSVIDMIHAEDIFVLRKAFDVGLSRSFGPALAAPSNRRIRARSQGGDD